MANLVFKKSKLFDETLKQKLDAGGSRLVSRFEDFLTSKKNNPLQPFGASDRPFLSAGFIRNAVSNETLLHAHLTHDVSVVYSISGKDPKVLKLYGLLTHDEMGTGQPPNIKKQKQTALRLANTSF